VTLFFQLRQKMRLEGDQWPILLLSQRLDTPFQHEVTKRGERRFSNFGFEQTKEGDNVFTLCVDYESDSAPKKRRKRRAVRNLHFKTNIVTIDNKLLNYNYFLTIICNLISNYSFSRPLLVVPPLLRPLLPPLLLPLTMPHHLTMPMRTLKGTTTLRS